MKLTTSVLALTISALMAAGGAGAAQADPGGVPRDPHCHAGSGGPLTTVQLGVFSKLPDLAVAEAEGFFAQQGLKVVFTVVPNSESAFSKLADGSYDLLMTSVDNVANYRLNAHNPLGHTLDVTAIAGNDGAYNLSLWSNKDTYAAFTAAGTEARFAVDSATSGFAYVGYALLETQGAPVGSYGVTTPGGTGARYGYLVGTKGSSTPTASLLNQGFDVHAGLRGGLTQLGSVSDVAPDYLGNTVAGLDSSLQGAGRCTAVKFTRALLEAARFTLDPANRDAVVRDIKATDRIEPTDALKQTWAEQYYAVTTTPGVGQSPDLTIDRRGLATVLQLRDRFHGFEEPQDLEVLSTPAGRLFSEDVLHAAQH